MPPRRNAAPARPRSMHEQARRLLALFGPEDRVLIVITADPDAMASALACKRLLWRRVALATITRLNEISRPDNLAMARLLDIPMEPWAGVRPADYNRLVMVDGQPHHAALQLDGLAFTAVIDHHPLVESEENIPFLDVRPRYGATATMLTEYLRGADIIPSSRLATALVFGIKNDTAGFQRPALEEDVRAFQYNFPHASQPLLRKIEFSQMRLRDLEFLRQALEVYVVRRHCVYAHLTGVKSSDNLVQAADFLLKIDSVDMTVVSGVSRERLVVIVRSVGLRAKAGKMVAQAFGHLGSAGGHEYMARAEIPLIALRDHLGETSEETLARFVRHSIGRPPKAKKPTSPAG